MKRRIAAALLVFAALAGVASGCLGDDATATVTFKCPNRESFTGEPADGGADMVAVSAFMERRCGTPLRRSTAKSSRERLILEITCFRPSKIRFS